jgi:hypothetical protein
VIGSSNVHGASIGLGQQIWTAPEILPPVGCLLFHGERNPEAPA